ncbi:MAG: hypothetical protein CMC66_00625 [Flavobacteriaceae bacterium]|nr:hypothetical protein [Flavobacteriaceae bacterium]|tara:strand:- start:143 stop:535 length:393 start_codon:yes stop_codon:yes gene_type:complete
MIKKITNVNNIKGIRISVKTSFKKSFLKKNKLFHSFQSSITIYNFGKSQIQILSNYKSILELFFKKNTHLRFSKKPLLKPGEKIKIYFNHLLKSRAAIINVYFSMISLNNSKIFKAHVPSIKLTHPEILN